jgi:transcriptional regulator with XRE-family HTH domain
VSESALGRQELAQRIRGLRKARELSIQKLADAAGISPGYLSEVERGHSAISSEKLARRAAELGVTVDYLLSGRNESTSEASIQIPPGLSEAAKTLDLTFAQTLRLMAGKESLVARRSNNVESDWEKKEWIDFYHKVKPYL